MIKPTSQFWDIFRKTSGALSCTEAVAIMNIAAQAPNGLYMELGTHKGKSTMAAWAGLSDGLFIMVEPEFKDEKWATETIYGILKATGKEDEMSWALKAGYSTNIIHEYEDMSFVFVDSGSHQDGLPMQEVKLLEDRIVHGGIIAFHDWDSQFKEVKEASDYLVGTGKYEYININWEEIIEYINENNLEEGNLSWHHNELKNPCFVGAVRRK